MQKQYFPYIDGLRALAVIAVILYHLEATWLPGGFTGVDVFFVISGYVVSASLAHAQTRSLLRYTVHFYARRFLRIAPALLVCLLVTTLVTTLVVPKAWLSDANESTGLAAFFGVSNIYLALQQDAYYSPRADFNPFIHTWSLGVEEQFYVLFPFLFFLWIRAGQTRRGLATLVMATFTVASFVYSWHIGKTDTNRAFYLIFSRFWELGAGALLYQLTAYRASPLQAWPAWSRLSLQAGGLVLIGLGLTHATLDAFPYPWAILPVAGTLLLVLSLRNEAPGSPIQAFFSSRPVVMIGRLSYSLYLWHWPVFVLMRWTVGIDDGIDRIVAISLTVASAALSFRFVEEPIRRSAVKVRWPDVGLVSAGVLAMVAGASISYQTFAMQPSLSLSVTRDTATWYPVDYRPDQDDAAACRLAAEAVVMRGGVREHFAPFDCPVEKKLSRVLVAGDSHAGAYKPMLLRLAYSGHDVFLYTQGGCGYMNLLQPDSNAPAHCREFIEATVTDIAAIARPGDIVFLPSLRLVRFGDQWSPFPDEAVRHAMSGEAAQALRAQAVAEATQDIERFVDKGLHVVLEAPKPIFKAPPFRCADWFNRDNQICAAGMTMKRQELLSFREPVMASLKSLSALSPSVSLWDPFSLLCEEGEHCTPFRDDVPLFFDGDHVTPAANMLLFEDFARCMASPAQCLR